MTIERRILKLNAPYEFDIDKMTIPVKHKSSSNAHSHLVPAVSIKPSSALPERGANALSRSYKILKLPLTTEQYDNKSIETFLNLFNGNFDEDDIYLSQNGNSYEIRLRKLSINYLENVIDSLKNEASDYAPFLDMIKQTIESVGSYGLRGNKRVYVGYNRERKVLGRKGKEVHRGKHYYANDISFNKASKQLPADYVNQIIQGDSEEELKSLPDNCIDLVFTSPPYNFGLDYDNLNDAEKWDAYFDKLFKIFDECIRILKYGGRLVINVQPLFSDYIPSHHIISNHLLNRKMIWKGEILWEKNNYNCKYTAWGSWNSPSSPYLKYTWEFIEIFCKGTLKKIGDQKNADINSEDFKKWVVGRWSVAPERNMKAYGHPAMFPEELARRVLLLFSFKGDTILDPFMGVGTTCLAAKKHGRIYLGIDTSSQYCSVAKNRLADVLI